MKGIQLTRQEDSDGYNSLRPPLDNRDSQWSYKCG